MNDLGPSYVQATALVAFGKKSEEYFHFFPVLLHVADVIEDHGFEPVEFPEKLLDR
jgi:hypothetical protein